MSLTDERLRTWVLPQESWERMCLGVLASEPRFTTVQLRHSNTAIDGGRGIEARFQHREIVWGRVGFRTDASHSAQDRAWVMERFAIAVATDRTENPQLWGFVFFTNVGLAEGELQAFESTAQSAGLSFVEIFPRERLRSVLDSPRGHALRYEYLGIPLSEAELADFFSGFRS